MLYYLFEYLEKHFDLPGAGLFQYITFRSGIAIILSLLISMAFGDRLIRSLKKLQVGESVRDLGLDGQKAKEGTPTMGGFLIILSLLVPVLLFGDLSNVYIQVLLLSTVWMSSIGFLDDYIKVFRKNKAGLKGKFKILGQVVLGALVGLVMLFHDDVVTRVPIEVAQQQNLEIVEQVKTSVVGIGQAPEIREMALVKSTWTNVPFFKESRFDYKAILWFLGDNAAAFAWVIFIPIIIFIITAVSNASNLTDGIDGLAGGVSAIIAMVLAIMAYVSENALLSDYLSIYYIPHAGEMTVFASAFLGACIGFLWFNSYPAKVFMGDTGSLMLGGVIASMMILLRKELLIPILCGIFLVETLSVMIQVTYFKYTRKKYGEGRRVFLMSPIHHHYQKKGMHESKIVTRFWIVGIVLAVITMITFKIR